MSLQIQCCLQAASTFDNQELRSKIALQRLDNGLTCNPTLPKRGFIRMYIHSTTQDRIPPSFTLLRGLLTEQCAIFAQLLTTSKRYKCRKRCERVLLCF